MRAYRKIKTYLTTKTSSLWKFIVAKFAISRGIKLLKSFLETIKDGFYFIFSSPVFYGFVGSLIFAGLYWLGLEKNLLAKDLDTIQKFVDWLGIPYGLLASLMFVRGLDRLHTTGNYLAKEAQSILILYKKIQSLPSKSFTGKGGRESVMATISNYVRHVIDQYDNEHKYPELEMRGFIKLQDLEKEIKLSFASHLGLTSDELILKIHDISIARNNRLQNSKMRIPTSALILLGLSSILWLVPFVFIRFENNFLGAIIVAGIAFIVITSLVAVLFYNEPINLKKNDISGAWNELIVKTSNKR